MDEYSQYARIADGSVFDTFTVAVAGKYFVIYRLTSAAKNSVP